MTKQQALPHTVLKSKEVQYMETKIKAFDTHTHINHGSKWDSPNEGNVYTAYMEELLKMNKAAQIEKMFCSTFASVINVETVEEENEYLYRLTQEVDCLYQWVVIDPRNDKTFAQAKRMLNDKKCVGIKLHPLNHKYSLEKYGDKLFSFSSEYGAIVQIHPEKEATYILPMADKYPETTFIMAHLGNEAYVDAIEFSKHGNVYTDTSGIASSQNSVIEYAVNRVGSSHILFGTDTYAVGFQRGRIEYAMISQQGKEDILRNNAEKLFDKERR